MVEHYAKVDLEKDECEAIAALAEIAVHQIIPDRGIGNADQQRLRACLNSVKVKMSIAASLFGGAPSIIIPRGPVN